MSLQDELSDYLRHRRSYAGFREGGSKSQKELGALIDLLDSMAKSGNQPYSQPAIAPEDPPDCVAQVRSSGVAAFEVTEFVSQRAIELNERARPMKGLPPAPDRTVMAQWAEDTFLRHLDGILCEKDRKRYLGGPYAEYAVLVHTDEPLLIRSEVELWLSRRVFGPFCQISSAYFLFSYEPTVGYPYVRLAIAGG